METLLTVAEIYVRYGFPAYIIDIDANVRPGTNGKMMQDIPVPRQDAELVLAILAKRTRADYSLGTIAVKLID